MKNPLIIPFFIPHVGCPFTCVYCNQWEISGQNAQLSPEEIEQYVEKYLQQTRLWLGRYVEIAFYGGSFTAISPAIQEAYLGAAAAQKHKGRIDGIRLSTRPDYISQEILERLLHYGVTTVELGVQSLVDEVLAQTYRGHTVEEVAQATSLIRNYPLRLGYQLMLGLPGDTFSFARLTGERTVRARPDFVRIYPTLVLKGTTLESWYQQGQYYPWSLEEAVTAASYWRGLFSLYEIPVARMGLQATENLSSARDLVAGPYHPAFGELVESRLFFEQIQIALKQLNVGAGGGVGKTLTLVFHPRAQSKVIGQKRANLSRLREMYAFERMTLIRNEELGEEDVQISTGLKTVTIKRQDFLKKYRI